MDDKNRGRVLPLPPGARRGEGTDSAAIDPSSPPRLVAEGLVKSYGGRTVVRGVSIDIAPGEIVGLLGPNGAGKTTTFSIVVGLVEPDEGTVRLGDRDLTGLPMYRRARAGISYLPQEPSVFRKMTVEQNLLAILETLDLPHSARVERAGALLAEFGLEGVRAHRAFTLSGGERRRVEIARALATAPHFILLDEPLAGIDPIAVGDIRDLVLHLKDRGIGVLITDHNVRETLDVVDRAYIIHEGRVLMEGTPAQIVAHEDVRRVYLGDTFSL